MPLAALLVLHLLVPASSSADARSEYLIRLLQGSTQFRVRAQAAISLGGFGAGSEVVDALTSALTDDHPAVRASAATSLARLGDARALRVLRSVANDPEPPVRSAVRSAIAKLEGLSRPPSSVATTQTPSGPARYYVAVGKPASRVADFTASDLERVQQILRERLSTLDGVELAAAQESPTSVRNTLRSRSLRGFYIDSAITSVERRPGGSTRVSVSLIVATYPDRAMRAIMQGAATAMGGGDTRSQAIQGAVKSAVSQLPQAMARD